MRFQIEETEAGECLLLGEDIPIKPSWLKQQLRHSHASKQILILDCTTVETLHTTSLQEWVEDLQIESQQGQCLIACKSGK